MGALVVFQTHFSHHRFVFDESALMRYGSPYFSVKEAGDRLRAQVIGGARKAAEGDLDFSRTQIVCANEVFPESAVADPIADLEVWDEWRSGNREFPYPGKYSRLGVAQQEGKVSSTTSMGVLGEIWAGLFGQCVIAPWILVRSIRHWPDFIYYTQGGRYAFVESKAFMDMERGPLDLDTVPTSLLRECLVDAIRQLNSDPFVCVWLSFTKVQSIEPLVASVLMLELDAPSRRREQIDTRIIPPPVVSGLSERAINLAAAEPEIDDRLALEDIDSSMRSRKRNRRVSRDMQRQLEQRAREQIEHLLLGAAPGDLLGSARQAIEADISAKIKKLKLPLRESGRRLLIFEQLN